MDLDDLEAGDEPLLPTDDDDLALEAATDDDELPPDDEGDGALDDEQPPPQRPRGRAAERIERVTRENRELRERLDRLERGAQPQAGPSAADRERAEAAERERLQFMSADEKAEYFYKKGQTEFGGQLNVMRYQMADQADSAKFEALCARNATANRLHDDVERQLREERAAGNYNVSREGVLKLILGDRALKRQVPAGKQQRRAAQAGIERERVAPPRQGRGAAPNANRLTERQQRLKRLQDVTF